MSDLIETAAKALYKDWRGEDCKGTPDWHDMHEPVKDTWRRKAKAALERAVARIRELESSLEHITIPHAKPSGETATFEQCKPLLAKISAIPLWRDTYSDGPDMIVTGILGESTDGFTPDDVRLARAIIKRSGD